jgi:protoporphyrin/coproporphyrin ferrochelatase
LGKIAVVLFNLGGPDSKSAIKPFLMNFFMDRNILDVPIPFRCLLAWRISSKRSKREASDSYHELGNKSPLLENSRAQALALEQKLNKDDPQNTYKAFVCMRYWHPMSPQVVREVRDWGADKVVLMPLYPQFSTTTTWSSLQTWNKAADIAEYKPETSAVCCYPNNTGFIEASAQNIVEQYKQAITDGHKNPRILFSAHGLPEKVIKGGDPYQWQCEQSAETILKRVAQILSIDEKSIDWHSCYQSRVGPLKWIGPSTEDSIEKAAKEGKAIIIYPHAFTQEHVETLVELDIEYRHKAEEWGIRGYYRAATVGVREEYINGLAALVQKHKDKKTIEADGGKCLCPEKYSKCCMRVSKTISV